MAADEMDKQEFSVPDEKSEPTVEGSQDAASNSIVDRVPDGGLRAWLFIVSCFMVECMIWGFAFRRVLRPILYPREAEEFYHSTQLRRVQRLHVVSPTIQSQLRRYVPHFCQVTIADD